MASQASESASATGAAMSSVRGRKVPQGSHMSLEELRINKGLLKEISKRLRNTFDTRESSSSIRP